MSRCIDADALEELFREVIGGIAKKPEMDGNLEHMVRASAMVIEMIQDAPTIEPRCETCEAFSKTRLLIPQPQRTERWIKHIDDLFPAESTIEPEPPWIPCEERLPEVCGRYLVTRGLNACGSLWNRIYIANYSNLMGIKSVKIWWQGNVGKSDFERLDDVLAWMPLPEPYREEGEK